MSYVRSMHFEDRPDYSYLRGLFRNLFQRMGFAYDYMFDWNMMKFGSNDGSASLHRQPTNVQSSKPLATNEIDQKRQPSAENASGDDSLEPKNRMRSKKATNDNNSTDGPTIQVTYNNHHNVSGT